MDNFSSKIMNKWLIRLLGVSFVTGGVLGFISLAPIIDAAQITDISIIFLIIAFILFGLSIFVGLRLFEKRQRFLGWAAVILVPQVLVLSGPFIAFEFVSGIKATIFVGGNSIFDMSIWLTGAFQFYIFNRNIPFGIGINFFALIALFYVLKVRQLIRARENLISKIENMEKEQGLDKI